MLFQFNLLIKLVILGHYRAQLGLLSFPGPTVHHQLFQSDSVHQSLAHCFFVDFWFFDMPGKLVFRLFFELLLLCGHVFSVLLQSGFTDLRSGDVSARVLLCLHHDGLSDFTSLLLLGFKHL